MAGSFITFFRTRPTELALYFNSEITYFLTFALYQSSIYSRFCPYNCIYYMEESVLLETKSLVESMRHSIRVAYSPFDTLASVISLIDVTIPAFSTC